MPGRFPQKYRALWAGLTFTASMRTGLHCKKIYIYLIYNNNNNNEQQNEKRKLFFRGFFVALYLEESADVGLVVGAHEDHVLKQPEERTVVALLRLQHRQDPVELEEESPSAFCKEETQILPVSSGRKDSFRNTSSRFGGSVPKSPFLRGLTMDRSLQGLPPISRSNGPHSAN